MMNNAIKSANLEKINYHRLLNVSILLGALLLENGAEIYRIEESIQRILHAYGIKKADVFAIPTMIIVSIETKDYTSLTKVKRFYNRSTNFDCVSVTNDYIRYICREKPSLSEVLEGIRQIKNRPVYGQFTHLAAAGLVGFSFTLLFSGTLYDALVALFTVCFARFIGIQMERFQTNSFFITVVVSFLHYFIATMACFCFPGLHLGRIITGTLMILVPGVAFTTSLRDLIAKDLLAGMISGVEAILIAIAIAIGSAISYWILYEGWWMIT